VEIALLFVLILLNGAFAMSEIALVTARKARLQRYIDEGDKGAATAVELGQEPTRFLSTVQIGISAGVKSSVRYVKAVRALMPDILWELVSCDEPHRSRCFVKFPATENPFPARPRMLRRNDAPAE
jgi:putative hemolysin